MASNGSLATQLRRLQERMRGVNPRVRHVVQVTADLAGPSPAEAADLARREILSWLRRRVGPLPEGAWRGDGFEHEPAPGQHASVIALTEPADYWAARLDHPDDRVPGRTWSTEAAVAVMPGRAMFGVRLTCASRQDDPPIERTTPGFVRQLTERPGLHGSGWAALPQPHVIRTEEDVERLAALIEALPRTRPVYVVSLPEGVDDHAGAAVDVERLADRCLGIADVFVIPAPLTFALSDRFGREYSVFNGAVRTYRPRFNLYEDPPSRHPLAFADRIAVWPGGAGAFEDMLIERAYESSIRIPDIERVLPSFAAVKKLHLELRRREAGTSEQPDGELFRLYEEEIVELRREVEASRALGEEAEAKLEQALSELDALRSREHWLRAERDQLRQKLAASIGCDADEEAKQLPVSLDDLQNWVEKALDGRLVIHPRAARAAKKADYENPRLAYQALLLLAREYRDARTGAGRDRQQAFESRRRELGLECGPTFAGAGYGEQGDAYYVEWRGRRRLLDLHLKNGGNTRDPGRCLRIYFFWDADEAQVVVGWLPTHLPTRAT